MTDEERAALLAAYAAACAETRAAEAAYEALGARLAAVRARIAEFERALAHASIGPQRLQ